MGIEGAFWFARGMHVLMLLSLAWLGLLFSFGSIAWCGVVLVAGLLLYEHMLVSPRDLRRMNAAFFTLNGIISMLFFIFIAASLLLRR